ncbi:MAG: MFS transporter [Dehalococcoidia bacterium]|nr:MFS transporter [Dehalococcoidia bacterium]
MQSKSNNPNLFYGWYVVSAMFFTAFLVVGVGQAFGIFVRTWETEWGVSVGQISLAASIGALLNGITLPIIGMCTDKWGGRRIVLISTAIMGLAFIAMAFVSNVWMLLAVFGVVICSVRSGLGPSITGTIVARWFHKKRGSAMSVVILGGSIGGLILVPLLTYIMIEFSWQTAWIVSGIFTLVIALPLIWFIVSDDPSSMNLQPDGEESKDSDSLNARKLPESPLTVTKWQKSLRTWPLWQIAGAYVVCGVTTQSISVHFIYWAGSEGISPSTAAWGFGLLSGINAIGVLMVGPISDRMQRKNLLSFVYFVRGIAFITLVIFPGSIGLWTFAIIGGASWLATVPLTTALTADVYGIKTMGTLGSIILMAHQLGGAAAVLIYGMAFDQWQSYDTVYLGSALLLFAAAFVAWSIHEKAVSVRYVQKIDPDLANEVST